MSVKWYDQDESSVESTTVDINEYGAFVAELHVPSVVDYAVKYAQIVTPPLFGYPSQSSVSINIADPRIPTGVLTIKTDDPIYRTILNEQTSVGVKLDITSMTYTGAPLPDSEVTVDWQITSGTIGSGDSYYAGL